MTINLVKIGNRLVGRTFSDRWNLAQLGYTEIEWSRNGAALKKARRMDSDFTFTTVKGSAIAMSAEERAMFSPRRQSLAA